MTVFVAVPGIDAAFLTFKQTSKTLNCISIEFPFQPCIVFQRLSFEPICQFKGKWRDQHIIFQRFDLLRCNIL